MTSVAFASHASVGLGIASAISVNATTIACRSEAVRRPIATGASLASLLALRVLKSRVTKLSVDRAFGEIGKGGATDVATSGRSGPSRSIAGSATATCFPTSPP